MAPTSPIVHIHQAAGSMHQGTVERFVHAASVGKAREDGEERGEESCELKGAGAAPPKYSHCTGFQSSSRPPFQTYHRTLWLYSDHSLIEPGLSCLFGP